MGPSLWDCRSLGGVGAENLPRAQITTLGPAHTQGVSKGAWVKFRPHIQGLRALAVLSIVGYHIGLPGFAGGFVGVDFFFVLSGYLITGLLVGEASVTGTVRVAEVYARRARRLLPAMLGLMVSTVLVSIAVYAPMEQRRLATTALAASSHVSNVYFAQIAVDYVGGTSWANPLLHMWSLSVEEQFYLAWPLIIVVCISVDRWRGRGSDLRTVWWCVCGLGLLSLAVSVYLTHVRLP